MRLERPLTMDEIRAAAPAVFQTRPHQRTSERYTPISTEQVVVAMQQAGFGVARAQQRRSRAPDAMPYARHLVCLRPLETFHRPPEVGGIYPEIVVVNGHDGYTSYQIFAGMYRLICENGMVLGETFDGFRVDHRGDIKQQVVDYSQKIWEQVPRLYDWIHRADKVVLDRKRQMLLAEQAMKIRFGDRRPFDPERLLDARRPDDEGDSLLVVYNRIQENLMKGGIEGRSATNRRVVTKPIARVTRDVEYNQKLWEAANTLLEVA